MSGEVVFSLDRRACMEWFAWIHYGLGHHYYVTRSQISCECGESIATPVPGL